MKRYRAHYIVGNQEGHKDWDSSSPITALMNIHRWLQLEQNLPATGYTILSLSQIYSTNPTGIGLPMVESKFDLPNTPNPDLHVNDDSPFPETDDAFPGAVGGKLAD